MDITQIATTIGFGVIIVGAIWGVGLSFSFVVDGINNWWAKRKRERLLRPWTEKEVETLRRNLVRQGTLTEEEAARFGRE